VAKPVELIRVDLETVMGEESVTTVSGSPLATALFSVPQQPSTERHESGDESDTYPQCQSLDSEGLSQCEDFLP